MREFDHLTTDARKQKALLAAEKSNLGSVAYGQLDFSGAPADGETVSIGGDVYQFVRINANTTADLAADITAVDSVIALDADPSIAVRAGDILRVSSEYLLVLPGSTKRSLRVRRGVFGTTAAAASSGADVFQAATRATEGRLTVPITTLTAAQAETRFVAAVGYWRKGQSLDSALGLITRASVRVKAEGKGSSTGVWLFPEEDGEPDLAETMTNGTVTEVAAGQRGSGINESAIAEKLPSGVASPRHYAFEFDVRFAKAELFTAAGILDTNQPSVSVDGKVVTVTEGSTSFAQNLVLRVTAG